MTIPILVLTDNLFFQSELKTRLNKLEKAVPALIAWNVVQVVGAKISFVEQVAITIFLFLNTVDNTISFTKLSDCDLGIQISLLT